MFHLGKFICRKLGLDENDFLSKINFWAKKEGADTLESLDPELALKEVNKNYWASLKQDDLGIYETYSAIKEYVDKQYKPGSCQRVLYYEIDIDDLL
jgi:hypothetical protein